MKQEITTPKNLTCVYEAITYDNTPVLLLCFGLAMDQTHIA